MSFQEIHPSPRICVIFRNMLVLTVRSCYPPAQSVCWNITPFRLSTTAYLIYSPIPSISGCCFLRPRSEDASWTYLETNKYLDESKIVKLWTELIAIIMILNAARLTQRECALRNSNTPGHSIPKLRLVYSLHKQTPPPLCKTPDSQVRQLNST
jgi:hypothetical protein